MCPTITYSRPLLDVANILLGLDAPLVPGDIAGSDGKLNGTVERDPLMVAELLGMHSLTWTLTHFRMLVHHLSLDLITSWTLWTLWHFLSSSVN